MKDNSDSNLNLFKDDYAFTEGVPDADGVISIIMWSSDDRRGSIVLPEPYRISKTPSELHTLGTSLLNSPR